MAKFVELRPGEVALIGENTLVTLEQKSGQRARLRIESPHHVQHLKSVETQEAPKQQLKAPNLPTIAPPRLKAV